MNIQKRKNKVIRLESYKLIVLFTFTQVYEKQD